MEEAMSESTGDTGESIPEVSVGTNVAEPSVAEPASVPEPAQTGSLLGNTEKPPEATGENTPAPQEPSIYGDTEVQWPEGFSDEFKNDTVLKPYVNEGKFNVNGAVKSLIHAQKSLGQGRIRIPTDDSPHEDWTQFHNQVFGYNADINDYGIEFDKENSNFKDDFPEAFIKHAHENMYPPRLVEDMLGYMSGLVEQSRDGQEQQYTEQVNTDITALETKWGSAFQRKISTANMVLERLGTENGFLEYMNDSGLKDDTKLAEFLADVGERLYGEDGFNDGQDTSGMNAGLTPEEAQIEINNIYSDDKHPYHNKNHANNQAASDYMLKLNAMKRGKNG